MNESKRQSFSIAAVFAAASVLFSAAAAAATVSLDPLFTGAAPAGASVGGLGGSWYKLDNDAHFSTQMYTNERGDTRQIKDFGWGTGIWAATDIAAITAGNNPYVTRTATSVGAVSYANNIYNNTVQSGSYGTWGEDYQRALAPIIAGSNSCPVEDTAGCGGEYNYAAVFSGYLYVAAAGEYDFGLFADDGFLFQLSGLGGALSMAHNTVAGSQGRGLYELQAENGLDGLFLEQGFYGIDLSYFNRLEAGVVDLGWRGPGATAWTTIDQGSLYNVPEPGSLALACAALLGLWAARRQRQPGAARRAD